MNATLTILSVTLLAAPSLAQGEVTVRPQEPASQEEGQKAKKKHFEIGTKIPEQLRLTDIDGENRSMKDLRGKTVVLAWISMECPYVKAAVPRLKQMAKKISDPEMDDVVLIGINSNHTELQDHEPRVDRDGKRIKAYAKFRKFLKKHEIGFTVAIDREGKLARKFQAKTTPHVFVIDPKGVLRYSGALDDDPRGEKGEEAVNYAAEAVRQIRADEDVVEPKRAPYGCELKLAPKEDEDEAPTEEAEPEPQP